MTVLRTPKRLNTTIRGDWESSSSFSSQSSSVGAYRECKTDVLFGAVESSISIRYIGRVPMHCHRENVQMVNCTGQLGRRQTYG